MPDHGEWERHWNTISLGIVTVATAAVGVALFASDLTEAVNSLAGYVSVIIVVFEYLFVLFLGWRAIFATTEVLERRRNTKRQRAMLLYAWFGVLLFTLAGFLIVDAIAGLLAGLAELLEPEVADATALP